MSIVYDVNYFTNNDGQAGYSDYAQQIQNKVSTVIDDIETELGISDWSGIRVLDAGCAFGFFTNELDIRGANVSGIDSSAFAIGEAQTLFPTLDFREESIIDTSFNPNTFDVILAIGLLETLADDTAITDALDEMIKIDKAIQTAIQLFPVAYDSKVGYQPFHFCFLYKRNKLVTIGQNNINSESAKAKKFAERFNLNQQKRFSYIHAEIDAISKAWGKTYIDNSYSMVVLRLNKSLDLQMSKPCSECSKVLQAIGLSKVWWSDRNGNIQSGL